MSCDSNRYGCGVVGRFGLAVGRFGPLLEGVGDICQTEGQQRYHRHDRRQSSGTPGAHPRFIGQLPFVVGALSFGFGLLLQLPLFGFPQASFLVAAVDDIAAGALEFLGQLIVSRVAVALCPMRAGLPGRVWLFRIRPYRRSLRMQSSPPAFRLLPPTGKVGMGGKHMDQRRLGSPHPTQCFRAVLPLTLRALYERPNPLPVDLPRWRGLERCLPPTAGGEHRIPRSDSTNQSTCQLAALQ